MGSIVSKLFLDFWIFFIFTRSLSLVWYNKKNLGSKSYLVINTRVV